VKLLPGTPRLHPIETGSQVSGSTSLRTWREAPGSGAGVRVSPPVRASPPASSFGAALRDYRRLAGRSQLQAALAAGVSQRHLSFLELGRANPSRGMVLGLGATLGLSLAQQNELLLAAGYAPTFEGRDPTERALVERALYAMLETHEPFPALLLQEGLWILKGNRGAARLWTALGGRPVAEVPRDNVFELMLRKGRGRDRTENWSEAAACLLRRFMAEQASSRRRELSEAAATLAANPEVKRLLCCEPTGQAPPVLQMRYRLDDARLSLFIVLASLQAPLDTRLEDLRIELFLPADEETRRWFQRA
jgi:transcriptional regulator with XRE-family HTH domain